MHNVRERQRNAFPPNIGVYSSSYLLSNKNFVRLPRVRLPFHLRLLVASTRSVSEIIAYTVPPSHLPGTEINVSPYNIVHKNFH